MSGAIRGEDLKECWCCGGLHDSAGTLCPDCDDAGCNRFEDGCESDHKPVLTEAGMATQEGHRRKKRRGPSVWNAFEGGYDGHYAFSFNGGRKNHIIDTTTFVKAIENPNFDRDQTNLGEAETVCGRTVFGRLVPLDKDGGMLQSQLCANCRRMIKDERVEDV